MSLWNTWLYKNFLDTLKLMIAFSFCFTQHFGFYESQETGGATLFSWLRSAFLLHAKRNYAFKTIQHVPFSNWQTHEAISWPTAGRSFSVVGLHFKSMQLSTWAASKAHASLACKHVGCAAAISKQCSHISASEEWRTLSCLKLPHVGRKSGQLQNDDSGQVEF